METAPPSCYHGDHNHLRLPWRRQPPPVTMETGSTTLSCYHGDPNPLCGGMLDERLMVWETRDASVYPITVQTFTYHLIGQEVGCCDWCK